jgi:hypothetical protein
VAAHQQRGATVREAAEQRPQVAAEHGVQPDRGLVQDEQLRRRQQRGRERDAGLLPAGQSLDQLLRPVGQRHLLQDVRHPSPGDSEDGREVGKVLGDRQVGVDRRRLGDVADAAAQRGGPGGGSQDGDGADHGALHPDERAHQRGLAAAGRAEQPGDLPRDEREAEAVQHLTLAAPDDEALDLD